MRPANRGERGFEINHCEVDWAARLSFLFNVGEEGVHRVAAAIPTLAAKLLGGANISDSGVFLESLVNNDFEGFCQCTGEGDASVA